MKIIDVADNQIVTLLRLLDMSTAFDTVVYKILLRRLYVSYSIAVQLLQWFTSFQLIGPKPLPSLALSQLSRFLCGVPHGSVLGLPVVRPVLSWCQQDCRQQWSLHSNLYDMQTYASVQRRVSRWPPVAYWTVLPILRHGCRLIGWSWMPIKWSSSGSAHVGSWRSLFQSHCRWMVNSKHRP